MAGCGSSPATRMSRGSLGTATQSRGCVYCSICTGPLGAVHRAQGQVVLREPSLGRTLGEVTSPFLGKSEPVIADIRVTSEGQCVSRKPPKNLAGLRTVSWTWERRWSCLQEGQALHTPLSPEPPHCRLFCVPGSLSSLTPTSSYLVLHLR